MNQRNWIPKTMAIVAVCSLLVTPITGYAQSRDHKGDSKHESREHDRKDKDKKESNRGKDPKKFGLHDNRDQIWKHREDSSSREKKHTRVVVYSSRNRSGNSYLDSLSKRRQQTKNEWRNLAILSGAVAVIGLLEKDNRLVFAGAAGALYSLDRYEKDRKSQSKIDRARAAYFTRASFYRNGRLYKRRTVKKDGKTYYQFVRK